MCEDIVDHYFVKVSPLGLKAQVVAYDRELCVAYFDEINRILVERDLDDQAEIAVVMTVGTVKEEPADWRQRFELTREQEADVKARFRDPGDPPRFPIVTSKLLTGFDAECEGVMYLDKPLRLHTLFQAICRTNRRWTNPITGQEKHYGLIVDYVGLGGEIARALRDADPDRGGRRPVDVDGLAEEFVVHWRLRSNDSEASIDKTRALLHSCQPNSESPLGKIVTHLQRTSCECRACGSFLSHLR